MNRLVEESAVLGHVQSGFIRRRKTENSLVLMHRLIEMIRMRK